MDKPLIEKQKSEETRKQDTASSDKPVAGQAVSASPTAPEQAAQPSNITEKAIGAYSPEATRPLLTKQAWSERNAQGAWGDDPKSRLAIRMFSRGVLGAAFFTAGGMVVKKWMQGYDVTKSFSQQSNKNPLTFIAKLVDTGVGKPIEAAVTAVAGKEMGLRAVHFRPTRYGKIAGTEMHGRSLGDEVVNITFDFFCASVGDAWGRDIAGWFDPHVKKSWMDEKGNINFPEAVKQAIKSTGRYIAYNGGEDWAVAIPYAYFMKGQRALIDRASPGFKYDFDRSINGGSSKVRNGVITGNYNVEGIIDLQNRFTVYNVGTMMYREAYDYVGNWVAGKPHKIYGAPDSEPDETRNIVEKAGDLVKWAARSAVKGAIVMTPAVPFFWITRTPQSKHRGAFIDPEKGILATADNHDSFTANEHMRSMSIPIEYVKYEVGAKPGKTSFDRFHLTPAGTVASFDPRLVQRHPTHAHRNNFDAYGTSFGVVDKGLNKIGEMNYKAANLLDKPAAWFDRRFGETGKTMKDALGIQGKMENFTRPMIYAAASYTPYMYAKAEFANIWDNGKTDMAAERMIDGVAKLNWGEFKAGLGEVWNAVLYKPLADPEREKEAQRRTKLDTSPPDVFSRTWSEQHKAELEAKKNAAGKRAVALRTPPQDSDISWQERVVSGPPTTLKQEVEAKPETAAPKSRAEQEAMRKALEELNPPTNSIN